MELKVNLTRSPRPKFEDENDLGFGTLMTDHMFSMDYEEGKGWTGHQITPYGNFSLAPSCVVLHYSQEIFEGLKAYKNDKDQVCLFRQRDNFERMNRSAERMCMPTIDIDETLQCMYKLLELDKDWIPKTKGTSLYIRPTMIATDEKLGLAASKKYKFYIILSPSGAYLGGLNPVPIYVEDKLVRSCPGGTGAAKTGGNYAASILASNRAREKGYSQVLWLDGEHRKYVEEVGAMNIFFVLDGKLVTPSLTGTILPGITRDSVIKLAQSLGIEVEQRRVSMEELVEANQNGTLEEAFGSGTAAVISPVGELYYKDKKMLINDGQLGTMTKKLYDGLTGIQYGETKDPFGWMTTLF